MLGFYLRWTLFAAAVGLLVSSVYAMTWWSVAGFLLCGCAWGWSSRRKALALDRGRPAQNSRSS